MQIVARKTTAAEVKLLNEINEDHADKHFGSEKFSENDWMVSIGEVKKLKQFLTFSLQKIGPFKSYRVSDRSDIFMFS